MEMSEISQAIQVVVPIIAIGVMWGSITTKMKATEDRTSDRLSRLEEGQKDIKEDITVIKDNHLAHLQKSYEELRTDIAVIKNTCEVKNCGLKTNATNQ
jgi:hypothetical protein